MFSANSVLNHAFQDPFVVLLLYFLHWVDWVIETAFK